MSAQPCPLCKATPTYITNEYGVIEHSFKCTTSGCMAYYLQQKLAPIKEEATNLWNSWANTILHPVWRSIESASKDPSARVLLLYASLTIEVGRWSPYNPKEDDPWLLDAIGHKPRKHFQPVRWAPLDPRERQATSHGAGVSDG